MVVAYSQCAAALPCKPLPASCPLLHRHAGLFPLAAGAVWPGAHNNAVLYMDPGTRMAAAGRGGCCGSGGGGSRRAGAAFAGVRLLLVLRLCTGMTPDCVLCHEELQNMIKHTGCGEHKAALACFFRLCFGSCWCATAPVVSYSTSPSAWRIARRRSSTAPCRPAAASCAPRCISALSGSSCRPRW